MPPPVAKKKSVKSKIAEPAAGPGMMFSKKSFFVPKRGPDGGKVPIPVVAPVANGFSSFQRFEPARRFVYDKSTGEAYAEWINNVAICIHTGEELFRSSRYAQQEDIADSSSMFEEKFDYSVPKQQHPNDFSISTDEMLESGFISLSDFKAPNGAAVRLVDYEMFLKQRKLSI
jgi:hypothetical protein